MKSALRVLLVEDSTDDAKLILRELKRDGWEVTHERVETAEQLQAAFAAAEWDAILCDYALPHFSGLEALDLARQTGRDIPFIFVSATIGEDIAVGAMKSGAHDYVMKDRLGRLAPALRRELQEAGNRREGRRAAEALHAREQEFRALAENSPDAICRFDREGRLVYANPAYCRVLGLPPDRLLGRTPPEVHPGDERVAAYGVRVRRVLQTGAPDQFEAALEAGPPERPTNYDIRLVPELDRSGRVSSVLSIGRDIAALKRTEHQLRTLSENSPDIILRFDQARRYLFVNAAMERVTGVPAEYFLGRTVGEIAAVRSSPAVADRFRRLGEHVDAVFAAGEPIETEFRLPQPGGELIFNLRLVPERDKAGQVVSVLTIAREITARQRAEEALRLSELRFRQVTENIDEVFWLADPALGRMIYVSPAYAAIWGRPGDHLCEEPRLWLDAVHPEDRPRVLSATSGLSDVRGYNLEYRIVRPDGSVRWVHNRAVPIKDAAGNVTRLAGVAEDITAKHQLEDQLRQAQKMESLGTLASGIAHDFNNILTGVLGSAEVARLELPPGHPVEPWIRNIIAAGNRARDLVQKILTFGRQHESEMAPRKLQPVIAEAANLLRSTIPATVQIDVRVDDACPPVFADDTQIHQVVMNLCTNAWHALPDTGGRIEIVLAPVEVTPELAAGRLGLKAGPHVRLAVRDNGRGMTTEVVARIFEPFFTTKPQGRGTGLGLAVVHGIVQGHGGAIFPHSAPGRGTLFEVFFPVYAVASAESDAGSAAPFPAGRGERILLVDDDATALEGLRSQLEHLGYRTVAVGDPRAALSRIQADPGAFSLVFTDYAMPDLSGPELAARMLVIRPTLPVLVSSGFLDPRQAAALLDLGVREILRKPVPLAELARALDRHLHPAAPS